jgi:hypothetical protein
MNERLNELLAYLRELSHVQGSGHYVNGEIKEVVKEIRVQLGFEKIPREVKDSKKLLFDSMIENPSFHTDMLFEAIVNAKEDVSLYMGEITVEDVLELVKLFPNVHFISKTTMFGSVLDDSQKRIHTMDKTFDFMSFTRNDILILDQGIPFRTTMARQVSLHL